MELSERVSRGVISDQLARQSKKFSCALVAIKHHKLLLKKKGPSLAHNRLLDHFRNARIFLSKVFFFYSLLLLSIFLNWIVSYNIYCIVYMI